MLKEQNSRDIAWHPGHVTRMARQEILDQKGCLIWLTGLSGSGKSTIAFTLEKTLVDRGHLAYVLDGDNIRHGLGSDLGFSEEDRAENIRRVGEVSRLFVECGVITIASFVSPSKAERTKVRSRFEEGSFIEIFVSTPLDVCEARDPKGLYQKARNGEIPNFTGISAPYEAPDGPEMVLDTESSSVEILTSQVLELLWRREFILRPRESPESPQ